MAAQSAPFTVAQAPRMPFTLDCAVWMTALAPNVPLVALKSTMPPPTARVMPAVPLAPRRSNVSVCVPVLFTSIVPAPCVRVRPFIVVVRLSVVELLRSCSVPLPVNASAVGAVLLVALATLVVSTTAVPAAIVVEPV